jgi:hypothetical protein
LWPESTDVQALTSLRRELHHLQRSSRLHALVDVGTRTLAWRDAASVSVDVADFESAADRGVQGDRTALQAAARLYTGDLLPDCTGEWISRPAVVLAGPASPGNTITTLADSHCRPMPPSSTIGALGGAGSVGGGSAGGSGTGGGSEGSGSG